MCSKMFRKEVTHMYFCVRAKISDKRKCLHSCLQNVVHHYCIYDWLTADTCSRKCNVIRE